MTLTSDAAFPHLLAAREIEALVVGADAILPDGAVVNKVGTRAAATVAQRAGIPVVVAAATDKVRAERSVALEDRDTSELYDGTAPLTIANPTFDVTPPGVVDTCVTEDGEVDAEGIARIAEGHRSRRAWCEGSSA